MKTFKSASFGTFFFIGFNLKRFAVGIAIDRYSFNLDLGPFWFSIEW